MTLDAIVESYNKGTLADLNDIALNSAQQKLSIWHDWRRANPDKSPSAVPPMDILQRIMNFIENLLKRRYGCND